MNDLTCAEDNTVTNPFNYDREYFNKHFASPFYRRYVGLRNRFIHREITRFTRIGNFLEIGFGDDKLLRLFNDDFTVYGIDISEFAVREIVRCFAPSRFKICDISVQKIPFAERFTAICAINTIEHLSDPDFGLRNIHAALAPGGIFLLYLPTLSNFLSKIQYRNFYDVEEHVFRPSIPSLRSFLSRIGFTRLAEYAGSAIPAKISNPLVLNSLNLYCGIWQK